jgi:hypothetical protein
MALINYTLSWSDPTFKSSFILGGGQVDSSTTSLELTGYGVINWGEKVQENLLHLLENFASKTPPTNQTIGQLWFDVNAQVVKVWNGSQWQNSAGNSQNAIYGSLSADSYVLPADNGGNVLTYNNATTTFKIYNGALDDSANWTFSKVDSGLISNLTGNVVTITNMVSSVTAGYVDITASRSGYTSITKRFSVSKAGPISLTVTSPLSGNGSSNNPLMITLPQTYFDSSTIYGSGSQGSPYGAKFQNVSVSSPLSGNGSSGSPISINLSAYDVTSASFTGANQSLGIISGYQKFPGGFIIQWTHATVSGGGFTNITWPTTFPNGCFGAVASGNSTFLPTTPVTAYNISNTGCTLDCELSSDTPYVVVIAIGH